VPATGVGAVSLNVTVTNRPPTDSSPSTPAARASSSSSVKLHGGQTVAKRRHRTRLTNRHHLLLRQHPVDIITDINGWFADV